MAMSVSRPGESCASALPVAAQEQVQRDRHGDIVVEGERSVDGNEVGQLARDVTGRQAYSETSGEDDPDAAAAEVSHLGVALYEIGHAHGWDSLVQLDGLQPRGSVALVLSSEDLLGSDPGEWPEEDLFDHDEERILFRQDDVYGA